MELLPKYSPTNMVVGTLMSGRIYQSSRIILLANGSRPCSRSSFFQKQKKLIPKIEKASQETVNKTN